MDQVQATLQLTVAAGGRILVIGEHALGDEPDGFRMVPTPLVAIHALEEAPADVVICTWPKARGFVQHLPISREVSVMMIVPAGESREEAIAFARGVRNCALLPVSFSLRTLLGGHDTELEDGLSARFLRRLPRLAGLWGRRKTGVVEFHRDDGAWDWIEVKRGGLVKVGSLKFIKDALQYGQIRFIERPVNGDASESAMTRLLLELAGTSTDSQFADTHSAWVIQTHRAGSFPISIATWRLLQACDGERPLWLLLRALELPPRAVSEELHALVRLRLVRMLPPADYSLHPLHSLIEEVEEERKRLSGGQASLGIPSEAPPLLRRRVARWKQQRYQRLSEQSELPSPVAEGAAALSDTWRDIFASGT